MGNSSAKTIADEWEEYFEPIEYKRPRILIYRSGAWTCPPNSAPVIPRPISPKALTIPNSQIAIRTCILYEHLHGKTVTEAFENFCGKVGNGVIDLRSFEFWFNRFRTGNHDLSYDINLELEPRSLAEMHNDIMKNIVRELNSQSANSPGPSARHHDKDDDFPAYNQLKELIQKLKDKQTPAKAEPAKQAKINRKVLCGYILFECLQGNSIFEAYEKLCNTVGKNAVKYWDFEYWYQKIKAGDFSMESDIDFDAEIRSLAAMPQDVVGEIMSKLGLEEKLKMRKVSQNFRNFMNKLSIDVEKISLKIYNANSILQFDEKEVIYQDKKDDCNLLFNDQAKLVKGGNYAIMALHDWAVVMQNQTLKLKTLNLTLALGKSEHHHNCYTTITTVLKKEICSLVENITLEGFPFHEVCEVLRNFKPGVLYKIVLNSPTDSEGIESLIHMNQWKTARVFESSRNCILAIPIENLFHFSSFDVSLKFLSKSDALRIREVSK